MREKILELDNASDVDVTDKIWHNFHKRYAIFNP